MDVNDLISREEFFFANCIATGDSKVVGYSLVENQVKIDFKIDINEFSLTDIFQNFSIEIDGSIYVGGESSAHGSCGFFYKKTGDYLNFALMSLDSEPFIGVELCEKGVRFLSNSGSKWLVCNDDTDNIYIESV